MKVVTWNVNGIRSLTSVGRQGLKGFLELFPDADIVCVQETKLRRTELTRDVAVADGWESFWCCCQPGVGSKMGYSGVATFVRSPHAIPTSVEAGLCGYATDAAGAPSSSAQASSSNGSSASSPPSPLSLQLSDDLDVSLEELQTLDSEGRALITHHGLFVLVNLYGPALTIEERLEERFNFKMNFYRVLEWRMRRWVAEGKGVVVVGDFNISPHPIDSCNTRPVSEFVQRPDRQWLLGLLGDPQLAAADVFRHFHPNRAEAYTCWSTASRARVNNFGSRIDLILVAGPAPAQLAASLQPPQAAAPAAAAAAAAAAPQGLVGQAQVPFLAAVTACDIDADQQGSDHAPVWAKLDIPHELLPSGHAVPACAGSRLFPGRQANLKAWLQQQPTSSLSQLQSQPQSQSQPLPPSQHTSQQQQPMLFNSQQSGGEGGSAGGAPGTGLAAAAKAVGAAAAGAAGAPAAAAAGGGVGGGLTTGQAGSKRPLMTQGAAAGSKRQRAAGSKGSKGGVAAGQLDLRNFFAAPVAPLLASQPPSHQSQGEQMLPVQQPSQQQQHQQHQQPFPGPPASVAPAPDTRGATGAAAAAAAAAAGGGFRADSDAAASSEVQQALAAHGQSVAAAWQQTLDSMKPPLCRGHKEPCVSRIVKKKGPNEGRQFWTCGRAEGPPPVGNCNHFQWSSKPRAFKGGGGGSGAGGSSSKSGGRGSKSVGGGRR